MLKIKLFGIGAAGNKAAIRAIDTNTIAEEHVKLVNTTLKDIPDRFKRSGDTVVKFSSTLDGCGKEPTIGHKAIFNAIKNKDIDFSTMIDPDTQAVILVTSTEGGTGSGATPFIAKYFLALNIPCHIFAFIGFQDETKSISNTLRFFKELPDGIILHTICNHKFLDYSGNYGKAESLANDEFVNQLDILTGSRLVPSNQNIDDTDHYKICTAPGYMDIRHINLNGAKNIDLSNKAIAESFESMSCLEYAPDGCRRLAVIINASQNTQAAIDNKLEVIKRYVGEPVETFRHIQEDVDDEEYIDIIISGLSLPEKAITDIGKKYTTTRSKINTSSKSMSDIFADMDVDDDFEDPIVKKKVNAADALNSLLNGNPKRVRNIEEEY